MHTVAYLTAGPIFADSTPDPAAKREHELQLSALRRACESRDVELRPTVWTDAAHDLDDCEAIVIGTTWDYAARVDDFIERLEAWSAERPLFNPLATVRWNLEKTYLRDLAARGVPIVPTLWRDRAGSETIDAAFDELDTDTVVVKPVVGQHSWRQVRLRRGATIPPADALPPAGTMIQPYLSAVETEGELSFVCFDRTVSHCVRKLPAPRDYRIQSSFGGREEVHEPTTRELDLVDRVLDAVEGPLLHARVDLIRGMDERWSVIELELIEPFLFPAQGGGADGMGVRFAEALLRNLGPRRPRRGATPSG